MQKLVHLHATLLLKLVFLQDQARPFFLPEHTVISLDYLAKIVLTSSQYASESLNCLFFILRRLVQVFLIHF